MANLPIIKLKSKNLFRWFFKTNLSSELLEFIYFHIQNIKVLS